MMGFRKIFQNQEFQLFFMFSGSKTDLVLKEIVVIFPFELCELHVSVVMLSISHIFKSNQGKCVFCKFARKINL